MPYERVTPTNLVDVLLLEPKVFGDKRGHFLESFNKRDFEEAIGKSVNFVQDNHSCSQKGVLRGLHYQIKHPQGKIVRVTGGEVFDVVVDLRRSSSSFGQHTSALLNSGNHHQLWIPPGFAHGFLVLSINCNFEISIALCLSTIFAMFTTPSVHSECISLVYRECLPLNPNQTQSSFGGDASG